MDGPEFDRQLRLRLNVYGPACPARGPDGAIWLIYKLPNDGQFRFEPPNTPERRAEILHELDLLLAEIEKNQGKGLKNVRIKKRSSYKL
jgi:hypothetical protein